MTATAPETSSPRLMRLRDTWRRWDLVRAVLVLLVLLATAAGLVLGSRPSSYDELRGQVADGEVATVEVDGVGLPPGHTGFTTLHVSWRDGVVRRTAEVVSARPLSQAPTDGDRVVIRGDVADDLDRLDPDVVVTRVPEADPGATLLGWQVPQALLWVHLGLLLACLGLLRGGAEPRRATRWAWAWPMFMLPPFGLLAFLLLAAPGPTRESVATTRRLTGGWSLLLTVLATTLLT